jgi:N-acetyldiaminopimelate deacetylase
MKHLYQIRRSLHKIPEPAFQEVETTRFVLENLSKFPELSIHTFDFPGVLAEFSGGEGSYLLFRADMDALPIAEKTGCEFASQNPGFMHACGHDVHMTILLGLVEYVITRKIAKNILFLFQPAEEGYGGAERVISTGVLNRYQIQEVYALHVHPGYPLGTIASNPSVMMGIPQEFDIIFKGNSSHAANPQKGIDAIAAACDFHQTLKQNLPKKLSPQQIYICHIGKISGGTARNIVSDSCTLQGTLRALTKETMEILKSETAETARAVSALHKTEPEIRFLNTYDPVVNSPLLYDKLKRNLPSDLTLEESPALLLGEDFGFFTTRYQGLMFWVGSGNARVDLHSPHFLPSDEVIAFGLEVFKALLRAE